MIGLSMSENKMDSVFHLFNEIDEKYLDMHQYQFLAGRGFSKPFKENEAPKHVVVNESFLKALNLGSPESAIGKNIWRNRARYEILGVVKDFIHGDLTGARHNSFAFFQPASLKRYEFLGVKISSKDVLGTMEKLEGTYEKLDAAYPFDGVFYEDQIAKTYEQHLATYKIVTFLAFLAITISTLGLLGMAVFTKESRLKEISIRKVLGASDGNIMLLLSSGFLMLIAIAGLLAIPVTLYIVDEMILNEFEHRVNIGLLEILSGFSIVLFIGTMTVFWQTYDAAIQNPTKTLRSE
jgi:ABC-type antimicrobial peptide transport system permease subunit